MPELIVTPSGNETEDRRLRREAAAGTIRRLLPGIYTTNLRDTPEAIVRRNIWPLLGRLFPGAVVSARTAADMSLSAAAGGPAFVFLTGPSRRSYSLPGIEVRIAAGPSQLAGDTPLMGLFLASPARQLLENLKPTRDRSGMARALGREKVEELLARQCDIAGEERLNQIRDHARQLARALDAEREFAQLDSIVGALLRTRDQPLRSKAGQARARGEPIDTGCLERLQALFAHLRGTILPHRPNRAANAGAVSSAAFIEGYFSNYIEGARFPVDEARKIVFDGVIPPNRPQDGHDVLATFQQLIAVEDMQRAADSFDQFQRELRARHRALFAARPDLRPGEYKTKENQAGNTAFVAPEHVIGTLREGFPLLHALDSPMARAIFVHFLISEVHPFADGNGRTSRLLMTTELVRGDLARIVIPTVFRDDYLGALWAMSRHGDPAPMVRCFDRAQSIAAEINKDEIIGQGVEHAVEAWARTYAFLEPGRNARFTPYDPNIEIEWRKGILAPRAYWEAEDADQPGLTL